MSPMKNPKRWFFVLNMKFSICRGYSNFFEDNSILAEKQRLKLKELSFLKIFASFDNPTWPQESKSNGRKWFAGIFSSVPKKYGINDRYVGALKSVSQINESVLSSSARARLIVLYLLFYIFACWGKFFDFQNVLAVPQPDLIRLGGFLKFLTLKFLSFFWKKVSG